MSQVKIVGMLFGLFTMILNGVVACTPEATLWFFRGECQRNHL